MTSEVMVRLPSTGMFYLSQAAVSAVRVASSAGKKLSTRNSCRAMSSAVLKVVSEENNRSMELFHL